MASDDPKGRGIAEEVMRQSIFFQTLPVEEQQVVIAYLGSLNQSPPAEEETQETTTRRSEGKR